MNVDDALVSRPGGIIRAQDINQIRHEQAPFVFPQTLEALQYMDDVRQNRSGVNGNFQGIDKNSVDVATILDSKVNERIDAVFKHHWNTTLRKFVETRIQEEVAEQATLLGKRIGELMGKRGEL